MLRSVMMGGYGGGELKVGEMLVEILVLSGVVGIDNGSGMRQVAGVQLENLA